jgi:hypothetical protein
MKNISHKTSKENIIKFKLRKENNIKMLLGEVGCEYVDQPQLNQDRVQ